MRANANETTTEYLMSCLPSAPLPDVAAKDFAAVEAGWLGWLSDIAASPF